MHDESPRVEFFTNHGILEIRYFDHPKDQHYYCWRLPKPITNELFAFWISMKKNEEMTFPLKKITRLCEFTMYTENFVEIKALDSRGGTNMIGWSLPKVVVEKLISQGQKEK